MEQAAPWRRRAGEESGIDARPRHFSTMIHQHARPDVVIIGAGAAGVAAARETLACGLTCQVLEARGRVGGRAQTDRCGTPFSLDLGCEWLHSADRNILAGLAPSLGFALDKREPPWRKRHPQRGFGESEQDLFAAEQDAFWERLEQAGAKARRTGIDRAAAELLDPHARYNGFIDAVSTYYNGAPLLRVSVLDFDRYVDTDVNWRVEEGYGSLIEKLAEDLPIWLGCEVASVDASDRLIKVQTAMGTVQTERLIVTVPSSVLAAGAIRFTPPINEHVQAAAGLPLGVADKLFLRLEEPEAFAPDTRLIGSPERRDTGTYTMRSRGRPLVEGYFGGDYARHLEKGGLDAFVDAARREIASAYGSDIGAGLTPIVATGWALDPLSLGSYSHALPGHADARAILATPIEERIFFAGEATSPHFFSTAHGAYEEGLRAARAVAASAALTAS